MDKQNFSSKNSESVSYAEEDGGSSSGGGLNVIFTKVQVNQQNQVCDMNRFPGGATTSFDLIMLNQQFMLDMYVYVI